MGLNLGKQWQNSIQCASLIKKNLWTPIQSHEQRYYHFVERRNDQKKVVHLEKLYNFVFEHFLI